MRTYTIEMRGLDATITVDPGVNTVSAYGILFDENADIVTQTESRRFSGFCEAEIIGTIAGDMMVTRRQIEWSDIDGALDALGLVCNCASA